jgi:hypothetical protein
MTCGVVPLPFAVRPIAVLARGNADQSEEPVVSEVVHLELDAFERRFEVRAVDARAAVALLDRRMMAALLRLPLSVAIHVHEDRMLLVGPLLDPGDVLVLLACATGLAAQVPPVVASVYPPRPSRDRTKTAGSRVVVGGSTSADAPEPS